MVDRATVYAPIRFFPASEQLAPFVPNAQIVVDSDAQRARIAWPDLTLSLTRMPDAEMGSHLLGLQSYVRQQGGGEALAIRVLSTLSVYGISAEPNFDESQRALSLIVGITQATLGLCYLEGDLLDERGQSFLKHPPTPPSDARVIARAMVLLAVAIRGLIEEDAGKPDEAAAEDFRERIIAFCESYPELRNELEPDERSLLYTPIGTADAQTVVDAVWRAEGAQVLLWALGQRDLPAHDAQEHPFKVAKDTGVLIPGHLTIFDAKLRSREEIDAMRLRLLALHWRMVEARLEPNRAVRFDSAHERDFLRGVDITGLPLIEGDLAYQGKAISQLEPSIVQIGQSIARERHHAANWLIGVHPLYSMVVTPT